MRKEDAEMFSKELDKIFKQYPDVSKELEKYVKNRKKIFETMFTKPVEFAQTFWSDVIEFLGRNAHIKGLVSEMLVIIEILCLTRHIYLSSIKEMLEQGKMDEVMRLLDNSETNDFWCNLIITEDDEDNNEDNGH